MVDDFYLGGGDKREGEWVDFLWNVEVEPFQQERVDLGPLEAFPQSFSKLRCGPGYQTFHIIVIC